MSARALPKRVAGTLICLWAALLSVQMPVAGCAHRAVEGDVADPRARQGLGLSTVPEGTQLRVKLRDGTLVQGAYDGIGHQAPDEYAAVYDAWRARDPRSGWPALGDSVRLVSPNDIVRTRVFEGFDWGSVRVHAGAGSDVVPFDDLRAITTLTGATFSAPMLAGLHDSGSLPLSGTLRLRTPGRLEGARAIPLDRIGSLQVRRDNQWQTAAVVLGLVGMAALVIASRPPHVASGPECDGPPPTVWQRNPGAVSPAPSR